MSTADESPPTATGHSRSGDLSAELTHANLAESDPQGMTLANVQPMSLEASKGYERGQLVGRYVVVEQLGAGAMGVVYRAFDPDLDRGVALKLVRVRSAAERKNLEIRARLLREAQAIAKVTHPNVIQVFDVGTIEDGVFVAMEFVDGTTLKRWMRAKARPWPEVVRVFLAAGSGLAAAHQAGLVHRDFKPDNVMLSHDGRIKVLDFGLARAALGISTETGDGDDGLRTPSGLSGSSDPPTPMEQSLTQDGALVGTPAYMAPEQHASAKTTARSDQFSFCVAMWEALYAERPFEGESRLALATNLAQGRLRTPPADRDVPRWIKDALLIGLAIDPLQRHPTVTHLLEQLQQDPGQRRKRVALGAGALAVLGGVAWASRELQEAPASELCQGATERLAPVWNQDRADRAAQTFAGSPLPFAAETWTKVEHNLDAFATSWSRTRTEACRATRVHFEQSESLLDLRMACLDRRLDEFDALVDVLETGGETVIIGSIAASQSLHDLSRCNDHDALTTAASARDAVDPEALMRVESGLAEARALEATGQYEALGIRVAELKPQVEALGLPTLQEAFLTLLAESQLQTGAIKSSRATYERAFRTAVANKQVRRAAFLSTRLVYIVGGRLADADSAFWEAMAESLIERLDAPEEAELNLLSAQVAVSLGRGDFERAKVRNNRFLERWQASNPDGPEVIIGLGNVATIERELGNYDAAIEASRESLASAERVFGPHHPSTGNEAQRLGTTLSVANRDAEALPHLERGLELVRPAHGEQSLEIAVLLDSQGRVLRRLGRLEESESRHRQAHTLWLAAYGPVHLDTAVSLMNIGYTEFAANKFEEALTTFRSAREAYEGSVGAEHPAGVYTGMAIGSALLELGRFGESTTALKAALEHPSVPVLDPTLRAEIEFLLARSLVRGSPQSASTRAQALELALSAQATYRTKAEVWASELESLAAWLAEYE